jgi:hypothetical protein
LKTRHLPIALVSGALAAGSAPANAQSDNRALLSAFCDAANIKGSTCTRAQRYPNAGRRKCDVKLTGDRYTGKFLAGGGAVLVVSYESGCEAHANEFGGSVVFEQTGGQWSFKGFRPGYRANDCIALPRNEPQDVLICITGHIGQGVLESGVAQMVFARDFSKDISLSLDFLLTAEDSFGAYGANTVDCNEPNKYFGLSKLGPGPRPETVSVEVDYADGETIRHACGPGFPRPKEVDRELAPDEAYVPRGYEKKAKFIIDLLTRKAIPQG